MTTTISDAACADFTALRVEDPAAVAVPSTAWAANGGLTILVEVRPGRADRAGHAQGEDCRADVKCVSNVAA